MCKTKTERRAVDCGTIYRKANVASGASLRVGNRERKTLKLRATNLDLGIEIEIPARVEKDGVIAIPADTLGNFLSNLPNEKNVTIEQVGEHLTNRRIIVLDADQGFGYEDFPTLPFVNKGFHVRN